MTSWHLRQLAAHGLVRDASDAAALRDHGRERWWEAVARGFRFAAEPDDESVQAATALEQVMESVEGDLVGRWRAEDEPRLEPEGGARLAGRANTRARHARGAGGRRGRDRADPGALRPAQGPAPGHPPVGSSVGAARPPYTPGGPDEPGVVTDLRDTRTRPLWRDRQFATYWSGQTVSQLGDRVSELALPLIAVTTLHAGPAEVGVLTAAIWAPNLLSVVVGAWVDHQRRKKRLLVVANMVQAAAVAILPVAHGRVPCRSGFVYAVALLLARGVLYQTSYPPFFARPVRRDQYVEANFAQCYAVRLVHRRSCAGRSADPGADRAGRDGRGCGVVRRVGAGDRLGPGRGARRGGGARAHETWRRAVEGLWFLRHHPYLRATLGCSTVVNLSFLTFAVVILFASRTLQLDPGQIGLAFAIGAVGGLVGAVLASPLARRIGPGRPGRSARSPSRHRPPSSRWRLGRTGPRSPCWPPPSSSPRWA